MMDTRPPAYRLEETQPGEHWDAFIHASPVSTLFSLSDYLAAMGGPVRLFWCLRGNERRAAVVINESQDGRHALLDDFVIHNGLIFGPCTPQQNRAQIISERFDMAADVAAALSHRYECVELALAPQVDDIRPFLWYNYGLGGPMYTAQVRYTAYLDLAGFAKSTAPEEIPLFNEISYARRQEVRKGIKAGIVTTEDMDATGLANFYAMTMGRQNIDVPEHKRAVLRRFTDHLLGRRMARLFVSHTPQGEPAALALFGWDAKRAYYLFGAGDPVHRNTPCGTTVLWDAFRALAQDGHTQVDLEGVNSPRRGWFKLSFGAELVPYYQLTKKGAELS